MAVPFSSVFREGISWLGSRMPIRNLGSIRRAERSRLLACDPGLFRRHGSIRQAEGEDDYGSDSDHQPSERASHVGIRPPEGRRPRPTERTMKKKKGIIYGELRHLLLEVGFAESPQDRDRLRCEHAVTGTM